MNVKYLVSPSSSFGNDNFAALLRKSVKRSPLKSNTLAVSCHKSYPFQKFHDNLSVTFWVIKQMDRKNREKEWHAELEGFRRVHTTANYCIRENVYLRTTCYIFVHLFMTLSGDRTVITNRQIRLELESPHWRAQGPLSQHFGRQLIFSWLLLIYSFQFMSSF